MKGTEQPLTNGSGRGVQGVRKTLAQLSGLNREIERQRIRLVELESASEGGGVRITGMPRGGMDCDRICRYATEIADLKALIGCNLRRCLSELAWIEQFIGAIEDSETRQILLLRYVNGLSWQQIAFSIGEHDEQVPRRRHNAFFQKLDENDEAKLIG